MAPSNTEIANGVSNSSSSAVATDAWPADLTRRLRVLLHTLPLDGIRRSDAMRDAELRHYDGLALSLRVLDVVIDRLGLEAEADREVVVRMLRPALSAMDAAVGLIISPERHERMLDKLLSGLRNDSDARRPFREEYTSIDGAAQAPNHKVIAGDRVAEVPKGKLGAKRH